MVSDQPSGQLQREPGCEGTHGASIPAGGSPLPPGCWDGTQGHVAPGHRHPQLLGEGGLTAAPVSPRAGRRWCRR